MRVLVIDNFDSFTYNIVQYLGVLGAITEVYRNDSISADDVLNKKPDRILISPGPGRPDDAGVSRKVIRSAAGKIPLLGICLGHQCLAEVYGCRIINTHPVHGKTSTISHDGKTVFMNLPDLLEVARYHSLVVDPKSLNGQVAISAMTRHGAIMGIRNAEEKQEGIQFHPESFMTPHGMNILKNFLGRGFYDD